MKNIMNPSQANRKLPAYFIASLLLLNLVAHAIVQPHSAQAAAFEDLSVRLDRMQTSTATNVRVYLTPSTNDTESRIQITFPSGFTVSSSPTINVAGVTSDPTATALPGTTTVTGTGQVVTIDGVTDLSVGTKYAFNIASGITTPSTPGGYEISVATQTAASAVIDSNSVVTRVISDDQVVVNASVGATFTFALSANSTSIGALDPGAVSVSSPVTATITTNAASGWYLWARSAHNVGSRGALLSSSTNATIAGVPAPGTNAAALTAGTEGYGMGATVTKDTGTGTPAVSSAYNGTGNNVGTLDPLGFRVVSSSNGTATGSGDVTSMVFRASISTSTPPATDYQDIVTIVAAGSF